MMKVLVVRAKGIISREQKVNIEMEMKQSILDGLVVHDDSLEINIMEFDDIEVSD